MMQTEYFIQLGEIDVAHLLFHLDTFLLQLIVTASNTTNNFAKA